MKLPSSTHFVGLEEKMQIVKKIYNLTTVQRKIPFLAVMMKIRAGKSTGKKASKLKTLTDGKLREIAKYL